ncbi:MAG: helical backbone metal receptor [Anaerolineales bacterium]|jgi:ABC-type Fe3+-hydroxamate transport system substrate-binding protein
MNEKVHLYCDALGRYVGVPEYPQRIVSLVSSLTETLFEIGVGDRVVGVSSYCGRYVENLAAPIVGDYLYVAEDKLKEVKPDLILTTTGVQRNLGRKLADQGFPVFSFPLPNSLHGILENVVTLGGLVGEVKTARELASRWQRVFVEMEAGALKPKPLVYAECWLGRHARTPGSLTFIHDLITVAGGENIFGTECQGYLPLNLDEVIRRKPDVMILFTEPEYPLRANDLLKERGWEGLPVIESTVRRGENIIHDGPSMMATATWLKAQLLQVLR